MNNKCKAVLEKNSQFDIKNTIYGFDRLILNFDESNPNLPIKRLEKHCKEFSVRPSNIKFHSIWSTQLDVFQPNEEFLKLIYEYIVKRGCRVKFRYVEISADFITDSFREAKAIKNFLLAHISINKIRSEVQVFGKSKTYYLRRRSVNGMKCPINFVLYHDRPSKLQNSKSSEKCCHIELRLTGSNAMIQFGLTSFKDVLDFDFPTFYRNHIKLVKLKSKVSFARLIRQSDKLSGTAFRKYANNKLKEHHVGGVFVMQELLYHYPNIKRVLTPVPTSLFD